VQNVVTYDTVIGVTNPDLRLKPGMTANVSIVVAHKDDVLQIKNAALRHRPANATPPPITPANPGSARPGGARESGETRERRAERTVYVLPKGVSRPHPVQIKTGISDGIMTEVVEGLKEGDQIVTAELTTAAATPSAGTNPFSGGPRRFP
jgi:HlyD family secretion protein